MLFYEREMEKDAEARRAAVSLIARGIASIPEVARLAGVSRQLVRHWCKRAGVDVSRTRQRKLADAWRKEMRRGTKLVETSPKGSARTAPDPH
jgi:transposase-like protein